MSAKQFSDEVLLDIRKYFWEQDVNHDGQLSWYEFINMVHVMRLELNENEVRKAFSMADKNNNNYISFAEFINSYCIKGLSEENHPTEPVRNISPKKLIECRKYFCRESMSCANACLSRKEFLQMIRELNLRLDQHEIENVFNITDQNRDGMISFSEFTQHFPKFDRGVDSWKAKVQAVSDHDTLSQCRDYFLDFDENGDGRLNCNEFLRMVERIGLQLDSRQLIKVFNIADKERDGLITFREFLKLYRGTGEEVKRLTNRTASSATSERPSRRVAANSSDEIFEIRKYFREHDIDSDGSISWKEFLKMINTVNLNGKEEELLNAFKMMDLNQSGSLTLNEFISVYNTTFYGIITKPVKINADLPKKNTDEHLRCDTQTGRKRSISGRHLAESCKYFWMSDEDGDGRLSPSEFSEMLRTLGMKFTDAEMITAFKLTDRDSDGFVSFGEFVTTYVNRGKSNSVKVEDIKDIYRCSDVDKKGYLSRQEISFAMKRLGNDFDINGLDQLMKIMNKKGDGKVTIEEFSMFLNLKHF